VKLTDRLADRLMDALPRRSLGVIALHFVATGLLFGAIARLIGWELFLVVLAAGCFAAWVALVRRVGGWWSA
jgi:hypothetical protein